MVACGHDVHRWEKLTDQDGDHRNQNAAGHYIQLVVSQLSVSASKLRSVVCLAHDLSLHNGAATAQDRTTCSGATNPSGPPFTVTLGAGGGIGMLGVPPAI